jgi:hypothetical protein
VKRVALAVAAVLVLAACNGGGNGGGDGSPVPTCSLVATNPPPTGLPPNFPTPEGVGYYKVQEAGPSTILDGYWIGVTLEEAFEAYKTAFEDAGYDVTDEEIEATDAEVNFAGGDSTGQVRLNSRTCAGTVMVGVTIRPGQ